jgi:O-methyltransferase
MEITVQQLYDLLPRIRDVRLNAPTKFSQSVVIPAATYSPWNDDQSFIAAYNVVQANTLVDAYRCYELWSLIGQMGGLEGDILEVGVWQGGTGCLMAHRAQRLAAPKLVYLCDTFTGVVKAGENDSQYRGGEHADASASVVRELATRLGTDNIEILQGIFPDDTGHIVADSIFSLCHIDVDVHDSARDVMDWVWPRLCVGGCVVYDDYGFASCSGVTRLVNDLTPKAGAIMLHNLNGHAVIVKVAP